MCSQLLEGAKDALSLQMYGIWVVCAERVRMKYRQKAQAITQNTNKMTEVVRRQQNAQMLDSLMMIQLCTLYAHIKTEYVVSSRTI